MASLTQSQTHNHSRITDGDRAGPLPEALFERGVVCLKAADSVYEAARQMHDNHVGDIVIVEERDGKTLPIGIVTDRDIVIHTTARHLDPESVKIGDIIGRELVSIGRHESVTVLLKLFTEAGVGRIPVVDDSGSLIGIASAKRLFQYFAQSLCALSSLSSEQQRREKDFH